MKKLILIALLCACAGSTRWSALDVGSELAIVAASAVDYRQTIDITRDCAEVNPLVGPCGNRVPPKLAFPIILAMHLLVSAILPHGEARSLWQWTTLGGEVGVIYDNWLGGYWPHPAPIPKKPYARCSGVGPAIRCWSIAQ